MVSIYKPSKKPRKQPSSQTVTIESMDMSGQGFCGQGVSAQSSSAQSIRGQSAGKQGSPVLFVDGALPGETVEVTVTQSQKRFSRGRVRKVIHASDKRRQPFCPLINTCGGCQLQHVDADAALEMRQHAMDSYWQKQLNVSDIPWQPAITGERRGYRRKARLAVDARNDDKFIMGFRQEQGKNIVDVDVCPVLRNDLSALITPLKTLLAGLPGRRHIGHVTLTGGDNVNAVSVRMVKPANTAFKTALVAFAQENNINLSIDGPDQYESLHEVASLVCHTEDDLVLMPSDDDFIQVNGEVNRKMVAQAMQWLAPQPGEQIADWFSGLGNFSLSLAKRGAQVQAVEGVAEMVQRAGDNASKQGVENIEWLHLDLSDEKAVQTALSAGFDKVLIDPSREGAYTVCEALSQSAIKTILYVSCNPSTLTRDVQCLLAAGYAIERVGLIEMFPYTRHLEVMMLLTDNQ